MRTAALLIVLSCTLRCLPACAEPARPVRFDANPSALTTWTAALKSLSNGEISEAAEALASLLNDSPDVLIAVGGGTGVSVEMLIADLLRRDDATGKALRTAVVQRLHETTDRYRWYDDRSVSQRKSRIHILRDAGSEADATRLRDDSLQYGQQPASTNAASNPTLDIEAAFAGQGWGFSFADMELTPAERPYLAMREWGVEPLLAAQPVVQGGAVIIRHAIGLTCHDAKTGNLQWSARFEGPRDGPLTDAFWLRNAVTATHLGSPSVIGNDIAVIAPGRGVLRGVAAFGAADQLSMGEAMSLPTLECRALADGQLRWSADLAAIPLCNPTELAGLWWLAARAANDLMIVAIDPSSGNVVHEAKVGELPDGGRGRAVPMYAAAIASTGMHVVVAFDEGAVVSFDTERRRVDWIRPVGLDTVGSNSEPAYVETIDIAADPGGGLGGLLPRPRAGRATIELPPNGATLIASCPGWTGELCVDLSTGATAERAVETESQLVKRDFNSVQFAIAGEKRRFALGPGFQFSRSLVEPVPASVTVQDGVFVQTPTSLRRLTMTDLQEIADIPPIEAGSFLVPLIASAIAQPTEFLLTEFLSDAPLWIDDGVMPQTVQPLDWSPLFGKHSTAPSPPASSRGQLHSPSVKESQVSSAGFLTTPFIQLPLYRTSGSSPNGVNVSIDAQRRMFLRLRVAGQQLDDVRLPGRSGDNRRDTEMSRAWQQGESIVIQLGRELVGLRLGRDDGGRWSVVDQWPNSNGYLLSPPRSRLIPPSYEPLDTAVGPRLVDATGRIAGDVAVTANGICLARQAALFSADVRTGNLRFVRFDRSANTFLASDGKRTWAVDRENGGSTEVRFDRAEPRRFAACQHPLICVNELGRWTYDERGKTLSMFAWNSDTDKPSNVWDCSDSDHFFATDRCAVVMDPLRKEWSFLHSDWGVLDYKLPDNLDPSHVFVIDCNDHVLIGISAAITSPGLLDVTQPGTGVRHLLDGTLICLSRSDDDTVKLDWSVAMPACAVPVAQPTDVPLILLSWNAKLADANGRLGSLPVTHVRLLNAHDGSVIVESNAARPITPMFDFSAKDSTASLRLDKQLFEVRFAED